MNQRFYSLDVFRGATVALMILVNNPGSWANIYPPLEHASWHGCTPTDLVFPFFLFAAGNAMAFVIPRLETRGNDVFWKKITSRAIMIFGIGLLLNWYPFLKYSDAGSLVGKPFESLRIFGVLQRIAVCYFFAAVCIHLFKTKGAFLVALLLLLFYWALCIMINPADPFSITGWFGTAVDKAILGEKHMYHGEGIAFDPEGLMSSFAAISQVIFGYLISNYILQKGKTAEMLNTLFVTGIVLFFTGYCWHLSFPINKKIWTSSFTLYTTGLATISLGVLIYLIEFKKYKGWPSRFFDVFGKNALFIFAMSAIIPKTVSLVRISTGTGKNGMPSFTNPLGWIYENICKPVLPSDPRFGSLLYALFFIAMMWLLAWLLDRKKIYIRV